MPAGQIRLLFVWAAEAKGVFIWAAEDENIHFCAFEALLNKKKGSGECVDCMFVGTRRGGRYDTRVLIFLIRITA